MSSMHDDFRAMCASLPRRSLPSPVFKPVAVPKDQGTYGRLTCSLCGSPSDSQVCGACAGHLARAGNLL